MSEDFLKDLPPAPPDDAPLETQLAWMVEVGLVDFRMINGVPHYSMKKRVARVVTRTLDEQK